jgi:hypothetical protein
MKQRSYKVDRRVPIVGGYRLGHLRQSGIAGAYGPVGSGRQ